MRSYHAVDLLRSELSEEVFHELISLYLTDLKKNLGALNDGLEAQSYNSISCALHCLKEVTFSLGLMDLYEETSHLEECCALQNFKSLSDGFIQFKEKANLVLKDLSYS